MKTFTEREFGLVYEAWDFIKKTIKENGNIVFDLKSAVKDNSDPFDEQYISVYVDRYDTGETDETTPFFIEIIGPEYVTGIRMDDWSCGSFPCDVDEYDEYLETIRVTDLPQRSAIWLADLVMNHYKMND